MQKCFINDSMKEKDGDGDMLENFKKAYKYDSKIRFIYGNEKVELMKETHPQYMNREEARKFANNLYLSTTEAKFEILLTKPPC